MATKPKVPFGRLVIGSVVPYGAEIINDATLRAQGWLPCNGNAVSRTEYADLFAVIGTAHGAGDGSNTFNLPDYRGIFLRGVDDGQKRDPDAASRTASKAGGAVGDVVGSMQGYATARPITDFITSTDGEHTHTVERIPNNNSSYAIAGSYQAIWNSGSADTHEAGAHTHVIQNGGDVETRPVNLYVNYIIRFKG
jgi:microcystin-dependent protein